MNERIFEKNKESIKRKPFAPVSTRALVLTVVPYLETRQGTSKLCPPKSRLISITNRDTLSGPRKETSPRWCLLALPAPARYRSYLQLAEHLQDQAQAH